MFHIILCFALSLLNLSSSFILHHHHHTSFSNKAIARTHNNREARRRVRSLILDAVEEQQGNRNYKIAYLVDAENVRGKSGFELSHLDLLSRTAVWSKQNNLTGCVSLVIDHGSVPDGYVLSKDQGQLGVSFAGPSLKADDVIARDTKFFQRTLKVDHLIVVTSDGELRGRCLKAASSVPLGYPKKMKLELMHSQAFINLIEDAVLKEIDFNQKNSTCPEVLLEEPEIVTTGMVGGKNASLSSSIVGETEKEVQVLSQILDLESRLRKRTSPKKRSKMRRSLSKQREKLASKGVSMLDCLSGRGSFEADDPLAILAREEQDLVLSYWSKVQGKRKKNQESTGDRIILAEKLRRQLQTITSAMDGTDDYQNSSAGSYVSFINNLLKGRNKAKTNQLFTNYRDALEVTQSEDSDSESAFGKQSSEFVRPPLRVVLVSDTHGWEEMLTELNSDGSSSKLNTLSLVQNSAAFIERTKIHHYEMLPEADLLIHCGDFAVDGSGKKRRELIQVFDEWLSLQPQTKKIVLRGNHDPVDVRLPISGAKYVSSREGIESIDMNGWKVCLVPYGRGKEKMRLPQCDILATHEPPIAVLDKCLNGDSAGCSKLRKAVEKMPEKPKLWACGHIHEGRGYEYVQFGGSGVSKTLVVNAANANPGRATGLTFGPVLLEMNDSTENMPIGSDQTVIDHEDTIKLCAFTQAKPPPLEMEAHVGVSFDNVGKLLVSVDMGLKTGICMFSDDGRIVNYGQYEFSDAGILRQEAVKIISSWEKDYNNLKKGNDEGACWRVSHVAIEGGERELWDVWYQVVKHDLPTVSSYYNLSDGQESSAQLYNVRPEEWRAVMLTQKEKKNKAAAKHAARMISRQILNDFSDYSFQGKVETDAAEAVLVGYHVARKLGWVNRVPIIRRYSNDNVVL